MNPPACCIRPHMGVPTLFADGHPIPAAAYISYLDDHARYADFARAGYRLYSFPAYFAGRGINTQSGIGPFRRGIFDREREPDFAVFDDDVRRILRACPDALIFPRICVNLPLWWENKYPQECNRTAQGQQLRESFSSEIWKQTASDLLRMLISHVAGSDYCDHIIGWHVAAGHTEEWFPFGIPFGGFGPAALRGYRAFIRERYGAVEALRAAHGDGEITFENVAFPDYVLYDRAEPLFAGPEYGNLLDFLEYQSRVVTDGILHFASLVKEATERRLLFGAFYGYNSEISDPRFGHHAIKRLLRSPDVDFVCGPNSYIHTRAPGLDWSYMPFADSVKAHGKLWLAECDTRTHLTRPLREHRPEITPPGQYESGVWLGPDSPEISRWLLRKNFGKNLISGAGQWWFDMWGGWYASEDLMAELAAYIPIQRAAADRSRESAAEFVVVGDEEAYRHLNPQRDLAHLWVHEQRVGLGCCGAPYEFYDISDAECIDLSRCRLLLFLNTCVWRPETEQLLRAAKQRGIGICFTGFPFVVREGRIDPDAVRQITGFNPGGGAQQRTEGKRYLFYRPEPNLSAPDLRMMLELCGAHVYLQTGDVLYASRHYLCIHAAEAGEKTIRLKKPALVRRLIDSDGCVLRTDAVKLYLRQYETVLFELDDTEASV